MSNAVGRRVRVDEGSKGGVLGVEEIGQEAQREERNTVKQSTHIWHTQSVEAFFTLRNQDKTIIAEAPAEDIKRLIQVAFECKRADYIDYVTEDVVKYYWGEGRFELLSALLALSAYNEGRLLRKDKLVLLVQDLQQSGRLSDVPRDGLVKAATAVISSPGDLELDVPLIISLSPFMLQYSPPPGTNGSDRLPSHPVWNLLAFTHRLAVLGQRHQSLVLLKALMEAKLVSSQASSAANLSSTDFVQITTSILVNACMERRWISQALHLLSELLTQQQTLQAATFWTSLRAVSLSLPRAEGKSLKQVAGIVTRLLAASENISGAYAALNEILPAFYAQAFKCRDGSLLEPLYALTRSPRIRCRYTFTVPNGQTLLWLFNHVVTKNRNSKVARMLAQHLADDGVDISYHDRPSAITSLASAGFAAPALTLWEKFAVDKGASVVLGSAATMLSLVRLFSNLARRVPNASSTSRDDVNTIPRFGREALINDRIGDAIRIFTETQPLRQSAKARALAGTPGRPGGTADISNTGFSELNKQFLNIAASSLRALSDTKVRATTQSYELRGFAYRVIAAFRDVKRPLHSASHFDLNALARAYFMLQEYTAGFDVLMTLSHRTNGLDIQDANVVISAIAAQSAAHGARMLERMSEAGMKPDAVSFGTVVHHAVLQGDKKLVTTLLRRAREQITPLSFNTIGTLIRNSAPGSNTTDFGANLEVAKDLVDIFLDAGSISTPKMGTACVMAALRADDPVMAFGFWKMLVKDKVDWNAYRQVQARRRIAEGIRRHCLRSTPDQDKGRTMLAELSGQDASLTGSGLLPSPS